MPSATPSPGRPFTVRGDREFFAAIKELQRTDTGADLPTKSAVVRRAVIEARDRRRQELERRNRKPNGSNKTASL